MKRVLLKLSGEALAGEKKTGFDEATVTEVAKQVKVLAEEGMEIGVVIGGGNFWRGRSSETIDRTKADQIGMLATVMNALAVSDKLEQLGVPTEVFTSITMPQVAPGLHPQGRSPRNGRGQDRHLRRRYGQPLLLHRHDHCPARR